jgi:hypothetical protein
MGQKPDMTAEEYRALVGSGKHRRRKYGNEPVTRLGYSCQSRKEAKRFDDLTVLRRTGEVRMFLWQVPFRLEGKVAYWLDFLVFWADGRITYEDVKGVDTEASRIKRRIVEAVYGIEIELP